MDFGEERLEFKCASAEYLKDRIGRVLEKSPRYLMDHYEGEEFIQQCLDIFGSAQIENRELYVQKYLRCLQSGIDKEVVLARVFTENRALQTSKDFFYFERFLRNYEWDYSALLSLDNEAFLVQCYREIAEREPDEGGYVTFGELLYDGVPKEGVLYLFGASPEVSQKKKIKNIEQYKKIYDDYLEQKQLKSRRKEKIKQILRMPGNIGYICKSLYHNHLKDDNRYMVFSKTLHTIESQNELLIQKIELLERELKDLKKRVDK